MMNERVQPVPIVIVEATTRGDQMHTPEAVAAMRRLHQLGWGIKRIAGEGVQNGEGHESVLARHRLRGRAEIAI